MMKKSHPGVIDFSTIPAKAIFELAKRLEWLAEEYCRNIVFIESPDDIYLDIGRFGGALRRVDEGDVLTITLPEGFATERKYIFSDYEFPKKPPEKRRFLNAEPTEDGELKFAAKDLRRCLTLIEVSMEMLFAFAEPFVKSSERHGLPVIWRGTDAARWMTALSLARDEGNWNEESRRLQRLLTAEMEE